MKLKWIGAFALLVSLAHPLLAATPAASQESKAQAVTLFVQPDCGYCARARQLLNTRGVSYTERSIDDPVVNADWRALGGQGVPLLLVGDKQVQGFMPERIEQVLAAAGY